MKKLILTLCLMVSNSALAFNLPVKQPSGKRMTGTQFLNQTANLSPEDRELAIMREIVKGNIPSFLRKMKKLTLGGEKFYVMPDYFAIGTNKDYAYIPMTLTSANLLIKYYKLKNHINFTLPSAEQVDEIYEQAEVKVAARPIFNASKFGGAMTTNSFYLRHNSMIQKQLSPYKKEDYQGRLMAGHKKDLVTNTASTRLTIYGWYMKNGEPIQPRSIAHHRDYVDYSHGIRFLLPAKSVD